MGTFPSAKFRIYFLDLACSAAQSSVKSHIPISTIVILIQVFVFVGIVRYRSTSGFDEIVCEAYRNVQSVEYTVLVMEDFGRRQPFDPRQILHLRLTLKCLNSFLSSFFKRWKSITTKRWFTRMFSRKSR